MATGSGQRVGAAPPVQRRPSRRSDAAAPADPAELLLLADADRDALADGLHDGALQALVVARYAADAAVRGGDQALARDAVQDALVTLRRAVWLIRPRTTLGLVDALAELSEQRVQAGGEPLALALDGVAAGRLSPAATSLAYRLVQTSGAAQVRLVRVGSRARLELDTSVSDAEAWRLRASAVGGQLVRRFDHTALLIPLLPPAADHDDASAPSPHAPKDIP